MKINYNLTEEDYINFNMFHIKNSKTGRRSLNIQRLLTPIFFLAFAFMLSIVSDMPLRPLFTVFLLISIIWILFYPKYFYRLIRKNTKKMIKEGKNDGLLGDRCLTMTAAGFVDKSSNGETKGTWSSITSFKEDNENFYLYNSSVSAYILPKREVTNVERVRNYIKPKVMR